MRCVAGIASAHRSHVKHFPDVAAYEDYYDIVDDTGENISELASAMITPTGVRDSGRAIMADIDSFIAGMQAATTIWAWK